LIQRGLSALARAVELGGLGGSYTLQAAIAACHARARTAEETNWSEIAVLYHALAQRTPSPVVEVNRAVAVMMAFGPVAALPIVDAMVSEPTLAGYHLLPAVRGNILDQLGRFDEARAEFERAASLTKNARARSAARASQGLLAARPSRLAHQGGLPELIHFADELVGP
jgi:predicted RNA polymerase sigma factor